VLDVSIFGSCLSQRLRSLICRGVEMRILYAAIAVLFAILPPSTAEAQTPACNIANPPAGCGNNMFFVQVDMLVNGTGVPYGGTDPNCGASNNDQALIAILGQLAQRPDAAGLKTAAGDLFKWLGDSGVYRQVANSVGGMAHDVLLRNGPRATYASCGLLAALIPSNASYQGYRISNTDIDASPQDPGRVGGCTPGQDCSNGYSRFISIPELKDSNGIRVVSTTFENWSHNRRRVGQLIVFFTMPPGATPPHPM